jgi:hypothetical protein
MTPGQGQGPDSPLDHVRAETYLRLRAEAELRRVLTLPRDDATDDDEAEAEELTAEHGLRQHSVVAEALAQAGAIDRGVADSVTEELAAALFARSWVGASDMADVLRPQRRSQPARPPAGPYLAVPVGITLPGGPGSGLAEVQVFALVIAPDRAILTTAGRLRSPTRKPVRGRRSHHVGLPFDGPETPTATDDRGNSYTMYADSSSSDGDGNWTCLLSLSPIPQPGARWLELTMSLGSPPVRVDLASHGAGGGPAPGPAAAAGPAERMVDMVAHGLLHASLTYPDDDVSWYDLSEIADIVTALDAVGALGAARGAVGRLVTLAGRLRMRIPPALSAVAQPAGLPAAWQDILENRDRGDGPTGLAPAAAVLPELGGTRFVLAGMRSGETGAVLQALAWGVPQPPQFTFFTDAAKQWSWTARDDRGRWHVATEGSGSSSDRHADMELELAPALHPDARSLEVMVTGPSGQVSATVPLDWWSEQ